MKALTLHQPWASLIALGVKTIETRSWVTNYRGPLAIHAGRQTPMAGALGDFRVWCESGAVWWLDGRHGDPGSNRYWPLTFGAVIAICELVDVVPIEHATPDPYGDFTPGRYAWLLDDIVPLDEPVPARGFQKLWEWAA